MIYDEKDTAAAQILIVDDVEINRMVLEEIIRNMGCEPLLAENGQQALKIASCSQPKLILSDISMPGMDGFELCKSLKANKKTKEIPIIFISAFDEAEDIVKGLKLGGEDYITKPFITEVVQARVAVHLHLYTVKNELMETNRKLQISVDAQLRQMEEEKKNILFWYANIPDITQTGSKLNRIYIIVRNLIFKLWRQLHPLRQKAAIPAEPLHMALFKTGIFSCDIGKRI